MTGDVVNGYSPECKFRPKRPVETLLRGYYYNRGNPWYTWSDPEDTHGEKSNRDDPNVQSSPRGTGGLILVDYFGIKRGGGGYR